ncbi:hypothetical protein ABIB06_000956 [Bradyrhizobium sp. LB8.2]
MPQSFATACADSGQETCHRWSLPVETLTGKPWKEYAAANPRQTPIAAPVTCVTEGAQQLRHSASWLQPAAQKQEDLA